jgi:hypothetical protein
LLIHFIAYKGVISKIRERATNPCQDPGIGKVAWNAFKDSFTKTNRNFNADIGIFGWMIITVHLSLEGEKMLRSVKEFYMSIYVN